MEYIFFSDICISKVLIGFLGIMVMLKFCIRLFKEVDLGLCLKIIIENFIF